MEKFKSLSEIDKPDNRCKMLAIKDFYQRVDAIKLSSQVPEDIQSAFNTAKNAFHYSWFVYGLTPLSVFHAYSTIEYSLRRKIGPKSQSRSFKWCLKVAIENKWIRDDGFSRHREIEANRQNYYKIMEEFGSPVAIPKLDPQAYCRILLDTIPSLRNSHAHGHAMVYPWGENVLRLAADLINQLY